MVMWSLLRMLYFPKADTLPSFCMWEGRGLVSTGRISVSARVPPWLEDDNHPTARTVCRHLSHSSLKCHVPFFFFIISDGNLSQMPRQLSLSLSGAH